jgi:exodeoxyribonuclease VII large subunit
MEKPNSQSLFRRDKNPSTGTLPLVAKSALDEEVGTDPSSPAVQSVSGLNAQIRLQLEGQLSLVWVQGELSNFKAHTSGHFYFSLKDDKSQIRAVMFRGFNSKLKFKPTDGLEVIIRGRVTVYEPRGEYQITVDRMEPVGAGALQKAFEQLKTQLKAEGLFEAARKKPIPAHPRHVAIVTSPTGAAIQDMINVLSRRNKMVQVTLVPTLVQGAGAAPQIIEALKSAQRLPQVDVIIVGRGGGSIEDLWAFNDEALARAIANCPLPIISAVGHEVDFTIADFVADLRAPTPSAAAELVAKSSDEVIHRLGMVMRVLTSAIHKIWRVEQQKLKSLSSRLVDPQRRISDLQQRNDELYSRLVRQTQAHLKDKKKQVHWLMQSMVSPEQKLIQKRAQLKLLQTHLQNRLQRKFEKSRSRWERLMAVLDGLSPLRIVERGYSITTAKDVLVKDAKQVQVGDVLDIRVMEGSLTAQVLTRKNKAGQNLE